MVRKELTALLLTVTIALAGCSGAAAQGGVAPENTVRASSAETEQENTAGTAEAGSSESGTGKSGAVVAEGKTGGSTEGETGVPVSMSSLSDWENQAFSRLEDELTIDAEALLRDGEDVHDIYSEYDWNSIADTFPEKFDLRNRGTVTSVKNQDPWGTCWSFATMAASETSLLNSLGMTAEEYKEKYGVDMDLSEKHLAWFTAIALPALNEYEDGKYPYDPAQAGEGAYKLENSEKDLYDFGGNYALATSMLASGVGVVEEGIAPYTNAEGETSYEGLSADFCYPHIFSFLLKMMGVQ